MDAIEGKLYSPFLKTTHKPVFSAWKIEYETQQAWQRYDATVRIIRVDDGYPVTSFRQLIDEVAIVTLSNKSYEMFYRGQTNDYKDNGSVFYKDKVRKTIIYPSICRPERKSDGTYKQSVRKSEVKRRYTDLYNMIDMLSGNRTFNPEYYFALFQHYDIMPTPLIDITQSLRVAATFALKKSSTGYVYVFGLPYPNQSISHYPDIGIVLVKLQNVCPVSAYRPRYQEGYLVGKYPFHPVKEGEDNLARRLIAKFRLKNIENKFWDNDFQPMPDDVLFPKDDKVEIQLRASKEEFLKKYGS